MSGAVERAAALLGPLARRDEPLGSRTTYRVGGPAALLVEPASVADLRSVREAVAATGVPVVVLGRGSNTLVADAGWPGLAVVLGDALSWVEPSGTSVRSGGGTSLPVLARRTVAEGLTGLEWMVGVPGSVGGAVRMNAGGHGSDVAASIEWADVVDLSGALPAGGADRDEDVRTRLSPDQLELGYRRSAIAPEHVVVEASFRCEPGDRAAGEATIAEIVRWRREHQPGGQNAGSVFTNPPGDSAGRLVDSAGLRGHRRGSAHVSPKHANFIQAEPGGSADDVVSLIEEVRRLVHERTGIELHPEVRLVGFGAALGGDL